MSDDEEVKDKLEKLSTRLDDVTQRIDSIGPIERPTDNDSTLTGRRTLKRDYLSVIEYLWINPGMFFMSIFAFLLVTAAFIRAFGLEVQANALAVNSFYVLLLGVLTQILMVLFRRRG